MWKVNLRKGVFFITLLWLLSAAYSHAQERGAVSGEQTPVSEKSGAPSIKLTEMRFEAGKVNEGTILIHDFEFVNAGNDVLKITDLVPA